LIGIIIDIFGALKENMMETERNLTEFCFICGIEKEKLDKSAPHGYKSHIIVNHTTLNDRKITTCGTTSTIRPTSTRNPRPSSAATKHTYDVNCNLTKSIGSLSKGTSSTLHCRVIGVVDEEEEDDGQAKEGVLNEINIELPELETTSGKAISKVKALFEKN
jgi:hypothetical protein